MVTLESRDVTTLLLLSQQILAYPHLKSILSMLCGLQHCAFIKSLIHNENISLFDSVEIIIFSYYGNYTKYSQQSRAATLTWKLCPPYVFNTFRLKLLDSAEFISFQVHLFKMLQEE